MDDMISQAKRKAREAYPTGGPLVWGVYEDGHAQGAADQQRLLAEVQHHQLIASRAEVARQDALIACLKEEIALLNTRRRA
jgi:hypothetical protein